MSEVPLADRSDKNDADLDAEAAAMHVSGGDDSLPSVIIRYIVIFFSCLFSLIPIFWFARTRVFDQYQRAVVFRLGKVSENTYGPGMFYFLPWVDTWRTVDLRVKVFAIPRQLMMTKDSVTITVDCVVYFYVCNPRKAILSVQNYFHATTLLASTSLRSVVGENELDSLLYDRVKINARLRRILDEHTRHWGIQVLTVEVRDVVLPMDMQRCMASQAEAERDRRAKVISADGEKQAAKTLYNAAEIMTRNKATMQLRYLQTLTSISIEHPSTIYFPIPIEFSSLLPMANSGIAEALPAPEENKSTSGVN